MRVNANLKTTRRKSDDCESRHIMDKKSRTTRHGRQARGIHATGEGLHADAPKTGCVGESRACATSYSVVNEHAQRLLLPGETASESRRSARNQFADGHAPTFSELH